MTDGLVGNVATQFLKEEEKKAVRKEVPEPVVEEGHLEKG